MLPNELELYLHEHIPLSKAMAVSVVVANQDEVVLGAPLEPNINHREAVFERLGVRSCLLTLMILSRYVGIFLCFAAEL